MDLRVAAIECPKSIESEPIDAPRRVSRRILLVDKSFEGEPDIERQVLGAAGEFEYHAAA